MNPDEYHSLHEVESRHWYYCAKRHFVRHWILRHLRAGPGRRLLDVGAGTGIFAREMSDLFDVHALDASEYAGTYLNQVLPPDRVAIGTLGEVPWADRSFDALTGLDLLEHVEDDRAAAARMHDLLRPGGLLALTVPADPVLWSDWDERLHHFRRYRRQSFSALFPDQHWQIETLRYTNWPVYPIVYLARRLPSIRRVRPENRIPPGWVNRLLYRQFFWSAVTRLRAPFGVSLLLVARRR